MSIMPSMTDLSHTRGWMSPALVQLHVAGMDVFALVLL